MALYDSSSPRLFIPQDFHINTEFELKLDHHHYIANVLRLKKDDYVRIFNGYDGEWLSQIHNQTKKKTSLIPIKKIREQTQPTQICYIFAPIKHTRQDYMIQKATEMGVSHLIPVLTQHSQTKRINYERLHANCIEAAEQCGVLNIPTFQEIKPLTEVISNLDKKHILIFCDENAESRNPLATLSNIPRNHPVAVLIGPEGGFTADERLFLHKRSNTCTLSLGPRILRADTAAIAALSLVQASCGDWDSLKKVKRNT